MIIFSFIVLPIIAYCKSVFCIISVYVTPDFVFAKARGLSSSADVSLSFVLLTLAVVLLASLSPQVMLKSSA